MLTTYLHIIPKLITSGAEPVLLHMPSGCGQEKLRLV
jgi:hypothetical protein